RRHDRAPPDHRVHDLELRAHRLRPAREQRGEAALHVERPVHAADRVPRPRRRGARARGAALAGAGGALRARPGLEGRRAADDGVEPEILDLRTIRPLDTEAILASVRRTHRLLVVQEGWPFAGVAAEIITLVAREAFDELDAPPARVTNLDVPMPYARNVEN